MCHDGLIIYLSIEYFHLSNAIIIVLYPLFSFILYYTIFIFLDIGDTLDVPS